MARNPVTLLRDVMEFVERADLVLDDDIGSMIGRLEQSIIEQALDSNKKPKKKAPKKEEFGVGETANDFD